MRGQEFGEDGFVAFDALFLLLNVQGQEAAGLERFFGGRPWKVRAEWEGFAEGGTRYRGSIWSCEFDEVVVLEEIGDKGGVGALEWVLEVLLAARALVIRRGRRGRAVISVRGCVRDLFSCVLDFFTC